MASTSTAEPSSTMEQTPNWVEMPHEIMMMILQRLGAVEILMNSQKVCTTWRRICKDPAMWKVIDMHQLFDGEDTDYDIEQLTKQAVHRSCGELIDISLDSFGTDNLLDYISRCSSKLNCLRLYNCWDMTTSGLINTLKRLPHLETLELSYMSKICAEDIEVIGRNCLHLKSFKMKTDFMECEGDVDAIASSMPALRRLKLGGITLESNDRVRAILNGCPHLESLDLRGCFYLCLEKNLEKLCRERIKEFKFEWNKNPQGYGDSDMDFPDDAINEMFDGIGIDRGEDYYGFSDIYAEDDVYYGTRPGSP